MKKKNIAKILLLICIALCILAYFAIPVVHSKVGQIFMLFHPGSVWSVAGYIRSYETYAVAASFLLMVFQAVAAPVSARFIIAANAMVFGLWKGIFLSWAGLLAGALVCFGVGRIAGRDTVEKLVLKNGMEEADRRVEKYGKYVVLAGRLFLFEFSDYLSYAAGITGMKIFHFLAVAGIGQIPMIFLYSYVAGV